MAVISVYGINDIDYEKNGAAVLLPTQAEISEEAGGLWEMSLSHPVDPKGIWSLLVPGSILKASVPGFTIENAISGENVDIYRARNNDTALRAKPIAPSSISYAAWSAGTNYNIGDKVTITQSGRNYQAQLDIRGEARGIPPPNNPTGWKEIANSTPGGTVLITLRAGQEFYLIENYNAYWLYVQTLSGISGYVQTSQAEYVRTEQVQDLPERNVKEQLFRIETVTADSGKKSITVKAKHVSYDLAGNLVTACAVKGSEAAVALSRIRAALLFDMDCTLATNLTEADGTYSCDFSWKNPINALLDPDTGIVDAFKAKCVRDNWDVFVLRNTRTDRGVRLTYGSNLTGVSWKRDSTKLINRVVPVAQKANGDELLLDDTWADSPILDSYPVIRTEYMKVNGKVGGEDESGGTWTEASLKDYMRAQAEKRFSVDDADKPLVELTVNFVLLGTTEEFKQYRQLERLNLYDTVRVTDPTINLDIELQVIGYGWDPVRERFNSIKLGSAFEKRGRQVHGYNLVDGCIRYNKLSPDTIVAIKEAMS